MARPKVQIRKPPAPKPVATVESFVRDGSASGTPRRAAVMTRANGATVRRMVVYLPLELAQQVAMRCALDDVDVSAFVAEAVERRLANAKSAAPRPEPKRPRITEAEAHELAARALRRAGIVLDD